MKTTHTEIGLLLFVVFAGAIEKEIDAHRKIIDPFHFHVIFFLRTKETKTIVNI